MCFCVLLYFTACMLYYCNTVGWAWCDWGFIWWLTILLQCFDTVGWVTWPVKISSPNDLYCVEWDVKPYSTTTRIRVSVNPTVSNFDYFCSQICKQCLKTASADPLPGVRLVTPLGHFRPPAPPRATVAQMKIPGIATTGMYHDFCHFSFEDVKLTFFHAFGFISAETSACSLEVNAVKLFKFCCLPRITQHMKHCRLRNLDIHRLNNLTVLSTCIIFCACNKENISWLSCLGLSCLGDKIYRHTNRFR